MNWIMNRKESFFLYFQLTNVMFFFVWQKKDFWKMMMIDIHAMKNQMKLIKIHLFLFHHHHRITLIGSVPGTKNIIYIPRMTIDAKHTYGWPRKLVFFQRYFMLWNFIYFIVKLSHFSFDKSNNFFDHWLSSFFGMF